MGFWASRRTTVDFSRVSVRIPVRRTNGKVQWETESGTEAGRKLGTSETGS